MIELTENAVACTRTHIHHGASCLLLIMTGNEETNGWMDAIPERSHTITTTDRPEDR